MSANPAGKRPYYGARAQEDDDEAVPGYEGRRPALEVFSAPFFYYREMLNPEAAAHYEAKRKAAFREAKTVDQVRHQFRGKFGENWHAELADAIAARPPQIKRYYEQKVVPIEAILAKIGVIGFDGSHEVDVFNARLIENMPTAASLFGPYDGTVERQYNFCFVLGPSGSGKTFFALDQLGNKQKKRRELKSVTLYFKPSEFIEAGKGDGLHEAGMEAVDFARVDAPERLCQRVKAMLVDRVRALSGARDWSGPLAMHVCIVLDDAGAGGLRGFFDDRCKVIDLVKRLEGAGIADSVFVVVSGTGLFATSFDSSRPVSFYRMKPWTRRDLEKVLESLAPKRGVEDDELSSGGGGVTVGTVANAAYSLPVLEALATNARCAYFLARTLAVAIRRNPNLHELGWLEHLSSLTPAIVDEVVFNYVSTSDAADLTPCQRPRFAAMIFGALSRLKKWRAALPELDGLDDREARGSMQLLQLNVQNQGGTLRLLEGESFAATLTPATTIVLFNLAGVLTGILTGWRGEEEVAALYAAHEAIAKRWDHHYAAFNRLKNEKLTAGSYKDKVETLSAQLTERLRELRVVRLPRQLQSLEDAAVFVPKVDKEAIMVNADWASFADVIAHRKLLKVVHTSSPQAELEVEAAVEMGECGLLKGSKDDRALRGLLALWDGRLDRPPPGDAAAEAELAPEPAPVAASYLQGSKAFPGNLIRSRHPHDGLAYWEIDSDGNVAGRPDVSLARPGVVDVTFVVCTNAKALKLRLTPKPPKVPSKPNPGTPPPPPGAAAAVAGGDETPAAERAPARPVFVSIREGSLDGDMQVSAGALKDDEERKSWAEFAKEWLDGVKVQFLFTRGT